MTKPLLFIVACGVCATLQAQTFRDVSALVTNEPAASATAYTNAAVTDTNANDDKHKLQAGDTVTFRIAEDRDPADLPVKVLTVTDTSELDVPYLGFVSVKDKTCRQVVAEVTPRLEKDYYVKATVTLSLQVASKSLGRVYIFGEVMNPTPIPLLPNETFTVSKAIIAAGGFKDFAKRSEVKVIRKMEDGQKIEKVVNMDKFFNKGKIEEDLEVRADDYIIVPKRVFNP